MFHLFHEKQFEKVVDLIKAERYFGGLMKTATITKIKRVNGSMLTFTFKLSKGAALHEFNMADLIEGYLNEVGDETNIVNSFLDDTDLRVGDVITEGGEIIEGEGTEEISDVAGPVRTTPDYRDAFEQKMTGRGEH